MIKQMESPNAAKLLIIGPKGSDRSILINCLREAGHRLGEAKTGTEGLARIAAESPELVVVDLDLPDIGGLEVCRRIQSRPQSATVPVILLSSVFAKISRPVAGLQPGDRKYY